ncbi:MAG: hypothetical protein H6613_06635 [Ignavibacteriales bacterium]|nr:hypothetical protein [Ignavibacteriales bacterium]
MPVFDTGDAPHRVKIDPPSGPSSSNFNKVFVPAFIETSPSNTWVEFGFSTFADFSLFFLSFLS